MSFESRDLTVRLVPGNAVPGGVFACNVCDSTPGAPRPQCPQPSKPQCQAPSVKPPKNPKKRTGGGMEMDAAAIDLALLRGQLRDTLSRL